MPDPKTDPGGFVSPGQMSIVYLPLSITQTLALRAKTP